MNNTTAGKKALSMLGLAKKAGKVVSGESKTETAVKGGTACLVIVATDASDNTKKLFKDKATYRSIPIYLFGTKEELGHALGQEFRSSVAITDHGFAEAIQKRIEETGNQA